MKKTLLAFLSSLILGCGFLYLASVLPATSQITSNIPARNVPSNITTGYAAAKPNPISTFMFPSSLSMTGAESSTTSILFGSTTLTGTPTVPSSGLTSPMSITFIDDVTVSSSSTGFMYGSQLIDNIYTGTGGRTALAGIVNDLGTTACAGNAGCVGIQGIGSANSNVGGTSGTTIGTVYGGNAQAYLNSGATYWNVANPWEDDISVGTGASVGNKWGHTIVMLSTDAVQGTQNDAALGFLSQSGAATSWKKIFEFAANGVTNSIGSGTVIGSFGSAVSLTSGWDFSNATFSGSAFKSNGFNVSGTGLTSVLGLQLNSYTVSTLPTCNSGITNTLTAVTDATSPTYNGSLTGGGTIHIPVFCNGTAWSAH